MYACPKYNLIFTEVKHSPTRHCYCTFPLQNVFIICVASVPKKAKGDTGSDTEEETVENGKL